MLKNLFRKVKQSFQSPKDTAEVIAEIHNEFDTAGEKLLQEAKAIIAETDCDKGERLKSLGFSSAKPVQESNVAKMNKKLAETIEYYRQYYPHNKFITEAVVEAICKKYNLLCGQVSSYIGDVPEKNVREMESFKLHKEDMIRRSNIDDYHDMSLRNRMRHSQMMSLGLLAQISQQSYDYSPPQKVTYYEYKEPFKICAPQTDFEMSYLRKDGYKLIPDPIVLQPVKGGYLIVTKWGLEASDESLVNETHN